MRKLITQRLCIAGLCALAVGLIAGLVYVTIQGIQVKVVRTDKAVARQSIPLRALLRPHTEGESLLKIGGKTYHNLRGEPPFYLDVPGPDKRVLFVTHGLVYPYRATLHVLDLNSNTDTTIDITDTAFGWNLGSCRAPGQEFTDFIVSADKETITLATCLTGRRQEIVINLRSKSIETERTVSYGPGAREK